MGSWTFTFRHLPRLSSALRTTRILGAVFTLRVSAGSENCCAPQYQPSLIAVRMTCERQCSDLITSATNTRISGSCKQAFFGREPGLLWRRTLRSTTKRTVVCPRAERAAYGGLEHRFHLGASLCGPVRGKMRSRMFLYASRTARVFSLPLDSPHDSSPDTGATRGEAQALRRLVALAMALLLLPLGQEELFAQQAPPPGQEWSQNDPYNRQYALDQQSGDGQQPYAQQPYPLAQSRNAEQLVAPIALYPDTLVAQVLAASTYPAQVVDADHWRQVQGYASPEQIAAGADAQTWDPSVKALTAFPQVLAQMDRNLQWTTDLGNAYYNQPQDVLEAVQVMRQRAQAAGNLQSTPQEAVSYDQGNIELAPVNPQLVYVPAYNPWAVYGDPVSPYPGFSLLGALGSFFGSSPVSFGRRTEK